MYPIAQATAPPSLLWTTLVPFTMMAFILYFFILRPQRQKERQRQQMLANIKKHDRVITSGGLHGVVVLVKEKEVVLLIDETKDVKARVERDSITAVEEKGKKGEEGGPPHPGKG